MAERRRCQSLLDRFNATGSDPDSQRRANSFLNYDAIVMDCAPATALHPMDDHELRRQRWETAAPITVGDNAWLGGGVIVCAGVTIGANTVVGAGSVVTRDLPAGVLAVGNPCRVVRQL